MTIPAGKRVLYEGRFLRLVEERGWEYVERCNSRAVVAIVAVTAEDKMLFVEQYRVSMGRMAIELPAGLVGDEEDANEDLLVAAERELVEETGYSAGSLEVAMAGPSTTGITNEVITLVLASGLEKCGAGGGVAGESIVIHEVPLGEVEDWLEGRAEAGLAVDPKIYAGLYFLRRRPGEFGTAHE